MLIKTYNQRATMQQIHIFNTIFAIQPYFINFWTVCQPSITQI